MMSTGAHKKFVFGTEFAADGRVLRDGVERSSYNLDEVEIIKQDAYAQGCADEVAKQETAAAQALRDIAGQARAVLGTLKTEVQNIKRDYTELARLVGERLSAAATEQFPDSLLRTVIESAAEDMRASPRLVIRLHPDIAARIAPKLQDLAEEMGLTGQIVVREDDARAQGDCLIEWANGSAGLNQEATLARIDAAIAAYLNPTSGAPEHG
jgi:flagellar assembly protein FliH